MVGDAQDMLGRLKAVLPTRWFPDVTPVLDGLLGGLGAAWVLLYGQLGYTIQQTRIATATDAWLDRIAADLFGSGLQRLPAESDSALRQRITRELLRERGTRAAVVAALTDLTGRAPAVFEPARTTDTGGWGIALSYATPVAGGAPQGGGGWGSLMLPFQSFVTAYRPASSGIATVAGYGTGGPIHYASLDMIQGQVTDAQIMASVAGVMPATAIAWTAISN
jgi:hypothetical protein